MKIVIVLIMVSVWLNAEELTFEALRKYQRELVLREFKALYQERQDIHQNLRQVLKHARAKNLGRNRLSFFQPIKESHDMENSNVFFSAVTPEEESGDSSVAESDGSEISGAEDLTPPSSQTPTDDSDVRTTPSNPWAAK